MVSINMKGFLLLCGVFSLVSFTVSTPVESTTTDPSCVPPATKCKPVIGAPSDCPLGQDQDQNGNCIKIDLWG